MSYGAPCPDLTPADLTARGYVLCTHLISGWCWQRRNPYGTGMIYGRSCASVAQAVADARHMAQCPAQPVQLRLLEAA